MIPQEQVFFTDHTVYVSNTRLVLRKGGTYPIANLAQVTFGRVATSRSWIGSLIFGLIFLVPGVWLSQHPTLAEDSVLLNGNPYLVIGGSLLLISFVIGLFQIVCPLYVVVLKGTFGIARPIKRRNRGYIIQVVAALNEALSKRDVPPTVVQSTHIGQIIQGLSNNFGTITVSGQGAQANIGTSGGAYNANQASSVKWPISSPTSFGESSLNTFHVEAQVNRRAGAWDNSRDPDWADQPRTQPTNQPGTEARKIIISYSHKDHQWLGLLRTHLALLERQQMITLWDDTRIAAGMQTQQAITDALKSADFALLLVSANFLASDVIMRYELPQILQRLPQGRFTLLPLVLSPCLYNESPLGGYQPFNLDNPLSRLTTSECDDVLVRVAREIQKAVL